MHTSLRSFVLLPVLAVGLTTSQLSAQMHTHPAPAGVPDAETQRAFALIKSLGGAWQGLVTEPTNKLKVTMDVSLRVTSRGNAVVHEMKSAEATDNPVKNDHPVTMMYLDGAKLLLTHYCDAGNRPRMVGRVSPDGKVIDFDFLDITGSTEYGHMQHATFTLIDATHHIEDWTYEAASGKTVNGHFDLKRVADVATVTSR